MKPARARSNPRSSCAKKVRVVVGAWTVQGAECGVALGHEHGVLVTGRPVGRGAVGNRGTDREHDLTLLLGLAPHFGAARFQRGRTLELLGVR